jgi:hypothetical protein
MTTAAVSVKKIRRFRVQPRLASVLRHLRSLMGTEAVTSEVESRVAAEIDRRRALWDTSLLYATLTPAQSPGWAADLWAPVSSTSFPGSSSSGTSTQGRFVLLPAPVALTFFVATLGPGVDAALAASSAAGDEDQSRFLTALATEASEQAAQFAMRLIGEEAEGDACELSPRMDTEVPAIQDGVLALLDAARVAVQRGADGRLAPRFTCVGHAAWRPPTKKRR